MAKSVKGQFLWHELWTSDAKGAIAFYSKVAGWEAQQWDQDSGYTLLAYKDIPMAGLMVTPREGKSTPAGPEWTPFIGVEDVQVTAWEAQRLGAALLNGPTTTPTVGMWAVLKDPQGATFAIYKPEQAPKLDDAPGIGDFSWHELAALDHKAAWDFYRALFGWKKTSSF